MCEQREGDFRLYQRMTGDLNDSAVFDSFFECMPQARKEKILRLKNREARKRSLAAGILLYQGLADLGVDDPKVRIAVEQHGRPYLPDFPDIHFSLSHSGEMALAAFSRYEIGCDIEEVQRPNLKVAERFFCPEELDWILQGKAEPGEELERILQRKVETREEREQILQWKVEHEEERKRFWSGKLETRETRFYRLWVLKESFLKATGRGFSLPMNAFCFSFTPEPCVRQNFDTAHYLFEEYGLESSPSDKSYFAAVCLRLSG